MIALMRRIKVIYRQNKNSSFLSYTQDTIEQTMYISLVFPVKSGERRNGVPGCHTYDLLYYEER